MQECCRQPPLNPRIVASDTNLNHPQIKALYHLSNILLLRHTQLLFVQKCPGQEHHHKKPSLFNHFSGSDTITKKASLKVHVVLRGSARGVSTYRGLRTIKAAVPQ